MTWHDISGGKSSHAKGLRFFGVFKSRPCFRNRSPYVSLVTKSRPSWGIEQKENNRDCVSGP